MTTEMIAEEARVTADANTMTLVSKIMAAVHEEEMRKGFKIAEEFKKTIEESAKAFAACVTATLLITEMENAKDI